MKKLFCVIFIITILTSVLILSSCVTNENENGQLEIVLSYDTIYAYAQEAGFTGTLEELIEMFEGDSAYDIAVANGYTGTETEWLATLTGAIGKDGVTPHIGENGNWWIDSVDTGVKAGEYIQEVIVSFYTNGGSTDNSDNIYLVEGDKYSIILNKGDSISNLPIVQKNGYVFEGWKTGNAVTDGYWINGMTISQNLELFAIFKKSHVCDDNDRDNICDICGEALTECADDDNDHSCDICGEALTECADDNNDHKCDTCDETLTECTDDDNDHSCDICGEVLTECADDDNDTLCEICGESEYLSFTLKNDETYEISNYKNNPTEIIIPDTYKGKNVTSIGSEAFYSCDSLTSVTIGDSVTSIGDYAFYGCTSLTKVNYTGTIDQWVQIEFSTTFSNPIYYAKNLYINNELVTEAKITTATSINACAFHSCGSLRSITIPASVTSIGDYAFYGCTSLTKVNYTGTIDQWVQIEFSAYYSNPIYYANNLYINNELVTEANITTATSINAYAFERWYSLTSVTIGNSVTSIGDDAFLCCFKLVEVYNLSSLSITAGNDDNGYVGYYALDVYSSLDTQSKLSTDSDGYIIYTDGDKKILVGYIDSETELILPNDITEIYRYAFCNCDSLTSVTIGNSVTSIGDHAFSGCDSLTSVTIGNSVTSIGSSAFYGCDSLTSVDFTGTIDQWVQIEFGNDYSNPIYYAKNLYINNELVTEANITTATSINACAFHSCGSLRSITIPASVTSIGDHAFSDCDSLTSVTIGNSVTSIGDHAFSDCDSLTSVTIGDSVTSIGDHAFRDCDSLTSVTIGNSVTSIGSSAFYGCDSLTSVDFTGTIDQWVQIDYGGEDVLNIIFMDAGSPLINGANLYINNQLVTEVNITTANSINGLAFAGCTSLTSVVIGESVTSIGAFAFGNCSALTKVVLPDTLLQVGMGAFIDCANLSYSVEGNIAYLGSMVNPYLVAVGAIEESNETNEITIHSDCKIISYLDYYDVYKLIVPASVTSIATGAFFDSQFVEIIVDENNEFYQSINGSLYTKDGTTLLKYVISVQDIANTVTKIEDFALSCDGDLGEIFVPESVTSIGCQFAADLELTESSTSTWRIIDYPEYYAAVFPLLDEVVSLHDIESLIKLFGWPFRVEKN